MNDRLAIMELLQILAGVFDKEAIAAVAPKADLELFTFEMSYGPRIRFHLPDALEALREDPMTRQAVVYVGRPEDGPTNRQPCTTAIQLIQRSGGLHGSVFMRSWDAYKGLTYDVPCFGGIVMAAARCLDLIPGSVVVTATSLHLYESDIERFVDRGDRRLVFTEAVPTTWERLRSWAHEQYLEMKWGREPRGIEVL